MELERLSEKRIAFEKEGRETEAYALGKAVEQWKGKYHCFFGKNRDPKRAEGSNAKSVPDENLCTLAEGGGKYTNNKDIQKRGTPVLKKEKRFFINGA